MAAKNRRVLVVEDNPNMSSLLAEMLEVFEVQSVHATDGEDALNKLDDDSIGMVITDLRMPKMSGAELLVAIKEKHPGMPVVVISGFSLQAADDPDIIAQADGFLSKPFKMNDIRGVLDQHFRP